MALIAKSLITYGIEITTLNNKIDFKTSSGGSVLTAVLDLGFYSPTGLAIQVGLQLQSQDAVNIYTVSVARNIMGGTQNRITIATNGSYLSLLFSSGPNTNTSAYQVMGYNRADYTGALTYSGSNSMGTALIPDYFGYNYLDNNNMAKIFGAVNIASSGLKEAIVFNTQLFIEVEFKYEAKANLLPWKNFFIWGIQQKPFDFTPEISNPTNVFNVTLNKTQYDAMALGYRMNEMLPDFPNFYQTGPLEFRIIPNTTQFLT